MPTYNESESIRKIAGGLLEIVKDVDLLIVDDNSPDGTGKIADEMAAANPRVHVLHRTEKNGLGPAYLAGFAWGFEHGYEYLVEMDADGSHRPQDLPKLIAAAPNSDLVIGSRWVKGGKVVNWPFRRELLSRGGNLYAQFMLASRVRDMTAGFRIYKAELLNRMNLADLSARGYSFQVEMTRKAQQVGAKITEVPITFVEREHGVSKMSQSIVVEAMMLVTKLGFKRIFSR